MRNLGSLASVAFVHISVSRALTVFVLASLLLTAVDYGKDGGLSGYDAVSLVTALALGDLVSRVTTGLVLDTHVVSRGTAMLIGFALQTVALAVMSFEKNYWVLLVCCFLAGLSGGGRIFICTVMVTEEFDEASLSLNLGVMNFITGVSFFVRPPVIGSYVAVASFISTNRSGKPRSHRYYTIQETADSHCLRRSPHIGCTQTVRRHVFGAYT